MTRHCKGTACIGELQAGWPIFTLEPTAQQARHEAVTCAKHVEHFDRKALSRLSLVEIVGNFAVKDDSAE